MTFVVLIVTAIICYALGALASEADRYGLRDMATRLGEAFELGRSIARDKRAAR